MNEKSLLTKHNAYSFLIKSSRLLF